MFDKEYSFRGSHAEKVIKLTAEFDQNHNKLFNRNLDVYLIAPIMGFLYQRKAELDRGTKDSRDTKIFPQQLINEQLNLQFSYRLILLLDKEYEPSLDERINRAFKYYGSERAKEDEELFEKYVRGGVDILFEKLIEPATSESDYLKNLYNFMEEFNNRYKCHVSIDNILNLCRCEKLI